MTANHERRSRLMGFKIKQESWDLEDYKKKHRTAQEAMASAEKAVNEIEAAIGETEHTMRRVYTGELSLDVDAIQAARLFLVEQQTQRTRCLREQKRAEQRAAQAEAQLKQAVLYVKALKQIKSDSDREIDRVQENQSSEQLAELWRQRYGRREWQR